MNVVSKKTLEAFWTAHPQAEGSLSSWYHHATAATWSTPQDIKNDFRSVDFVGDNRVIFDIGGNNYRLVVRISYPFKQILVKFVGTHEEYDEIDPEKV